MNRKPNSGSFKKGQSGNPNGRPKVVKAIQELAREHCPQAIETLVEVAKSGSAAARVSAAIALLDRGYGKPPQFTTGDAANFKRAMEMSDDELASIAAGRSNGAAPQASDPSQLH